MYYKTTENNLITFLLIILVLVIGYFCAKLAGSLYYGSLLEKLSPQSRPAEQELENQINQATDPYKIALMGSAYLRSHQDELGLKAFAKSTQLDPNWRDGWVWLGYAQLKLDQPQLALTTLKKAESLDPIHPLTYKLLGIAYEETGDNQKSIAAKDKYEYLEKTF